MSNLNAIQNMKNSIGKFKIPNNSQERHPVRQTETVINRIQYLNLEIIQTNKQTKICTIIGNLEIWFEHCLVPHIRSRRAQVEFYVITRFDAFIDPEAFHDKVLHPVIVPTYNCSVVEIETVTSLYNICV